MKAKIWPAVLATILFVSAVTPDTGLAQGIGGSGQFQSSFGAQSFPGGTSALGRSWFFMPGPQGHRYGYGRGWNSGFHFGSGNAGFGRSFWGRDGSMPLDSSPFFYNQYPGYGQYMGWQTDTTNTFAEQWANRNPFEMPTSSGLGGSPLLSEGMKEEEVIKILGSPVDRTKLGDVEVWKYSGYSLYFTGGVLKSLR